jgi:hypothetical protein
MDPWYYKNLGDAMLAQESLDRIEAAVRSADRNALDSGQIAVFVRHVSEGRLHCQVEVFFSPASFIIADQFGAAACAGPDVAGLGLLAGSEAAWSRLFPADTEGSPNPG